MCQRGLFCAAGVCKRERALGEACESHVECAGSMHCSPEKKCTLPLPEGSSCSSNYELQGHRAASGCEGDMRCVDKICSHPPPVEVKANGESCAPTTDARVICYPGDCDKATNRCVPSEKKKTSEVSAPEKACP